MKNKQYRTLNIKECITIFGFLLVFLSACNSTANTASNSSNSGYLSPQNSINILNSMTAANNKSTLPQILLGSTIGNQQSFNVLQVTGPVVVESETITFYTDSACTIASQTAVFTGPATYSSANGTLHTTDQSLYYTCESMLVGGCTGESITINSVRFSYTMTNGQTTTIACMTNERIADYSTTPASACTSNSPCGFSNTYPVYTLFPAFAWVSGESIINQNGVYGTQGIQSSTNMPGARYASISWGDNSNNLWLFGGAGYSASGAAGNLNDLWKYNLLTKSWTWVSGESTLNGNGIYGTRGTASSSNIPGARHSSISWINGAGNFWLFGGNGIANNSNGSLNDLWQYNPITKSWTWMSGESMLNGSGVYGNQGTPSANNIPGARYSSTSWIDNSGNLWLFGGNGYDKNGANDPLNDLWKYNPTTESWTWMSGSSTIAAYGIYGTKGSPSINNTPGARAGAIGWVDTSNNLWLFGGQGHAASGGAGFLNDLWKYNPNTGLWTWMSGESTLNVVGVYGSQGIPSANNMPGARIVAVSWIDTSGNLWLFGGSNNGSTSGFNDLWQYNPTTESWTWTGGESTINGNGAYGTQEISSSTNIPGARAAFISWIDSSGNMWLFGGQGYTTGGSLGILNDLWEINLGN